MDFDDILDPEIKNTKDPKLKAKLVKLKNKLAERMKEFGKGTKGRKGIDLTFEVVSESEQVFDRLLASVKNQGLLLDAVVGPEGLFNKIAQGAEQGRLLFKDIDENLAAYEALTENMRSFAMVSEPVRQEMIQLTAVFGELGVSAESIGSIMDSTVIGFGKSGEAAKQLVLDIGQIGQVTGVGMQRAMENFSNAQSTMAYDAQTLVENFTQLQITAAQTGVSFDKLTGAFGSTMDEFGGSAQKAGSLNAILGKSVFNSIDLLGKTEAQRVETIIQGIRQSVDVKALGQNKFQLKAVAEGLGLTPDETRRLLSGQMSVDQALAAKEKKDPRERALNKMAELIETRTIPSLQDFEYQIRRTRFFTENIAGEINNSLQGLYTGTLKSFGESLGDFGKTFFAGADTAAGFGGALSNLLNQLKADDLKAFAKIFELDYGKMLKDGSVDLSSVATELADKKTQENFASFLERVQDRVKPPDFNPTTGEGSQFGRFRVINRETTARTRENLGDMAEDAISGLTGGVVAFLEKLKDFGVDLGADVEGILTKLKAKKNDQ